MGLVHRVKWLLCFAAFLSSSCVAQKIPAADQDNSCSGPVDGWLPCEEANALGDFLFDLEGLPRTLEITRASCNETETLLFSCNCSVHPSDKQCHVTVIQINTGAVTGEIVDDVGLLEYLTILDLSENRLYGSIPASLGKLSRLQILDLEYNRLSGSIPRSLGNLSSLSRLSLSFNFLNGTIPPSLGKLSSLQELSLDLNNLTGSIPPELGNLVNLETLDLTENRLVGALPGSFQNLTKLNIFWLASNNLTGTIPYTYGRLTSLTSVHLSGNHLNGTIPSFIAHWRSLKYLILRGNHFESIAPEIFGMSALQYLMITDVPSKGDFKFPNLSALANIRKLVLRNCSITGPIHSTISRLSNLNKLDLSYNKLTGDLSALENLNSTSMLLSDNQLSGSIPSKLLGSQNDSAVLRDFSYNDFTNDGNEEHANLTYIKPNRNNVTAKALRQQYCTKRKSKYHSLFINCGGGEMRVNKSLVYQADNSTSNSEIYDGWGYSCSGSFTETVSRPLPSYYIQNSTCGASGSNSELYKEARLCPTLLKYFAFCLHKGKYDVKLHFRDTVYATDEDYSSYGKRVFDVYIQGNRNLTNFYLRENINRPDNISEQSFEAHVGDNGMLDIKLYWPGMGSSSSPTALHGPIISAISITPKFKVGLKPWEIALIALACLLAVLPPLAFVLWRTGWIGDRDLREKSIHIQGRPYTVKQVVDATKGFSAKEEVGKGKYGTVYKAELPNGPVVAVKKLSFRSPQVKRQIESEVYTLKQLKHEHLVELFGGYSDTGRDLHLLVYEFMEHKSVGEALFDPNTNVELTWANRYEICRGMAKGLHYLHSSRFKIVHRNIIANNILLDATLKAKIADLGLAKLQEEENPYFAVGAGGTLVYMAPEYATRKAISDKVDVYSFGVVLLEIVSGKNNADYKEGQEAEFLLETACILQTKGRLMDLVNGRLLSDKSYDRKQARKVLELAMMCVEQSHSLRPGMSQVVAVLEDQLSLEQLSKQIDPSA